MLALEVPENELVERLLLRGKDSGRADDQNEMVIRNRIEVYNNQTAVLKHYYDAKKKFRAIDGVGSIEEITQRLVHSINSL
jgi:adenylate kinase